MRARLVTVGLIWASLAASPAAAAGSPAQTLSERYAPIVAVQHHANPCGAGEQYRPIDVDAIMGNPDVELRGPGKRNPVVKTGPTAADLYGKGEEFNLNFPPDALNPGCDYEKLEERWNGNRLPVSYAHIVKERGVLALQYWLYYLYNDFNNLHETDWEMVQLLFRAPNARAALQTHPYAVGYSQHKGGEHASWDDDKLKKEGTHPVVYAAAGSHAEYFSNGVWLGRSGKEGVGCDDTSAPSIELKPTPLLVPTAVSSPSDKYAWLGFTGHWGQKEASFNNGPTGPQTGGKWLKPLEWQDEKTRDSSVRIPVVRTLGPSVSDFFCGAVKKGSELYILVKKEPLAALGVLLGLLLLVALGLTRTRWRPVRTEPVEMRRALGQIFRTAFRFYLRHGKLFIGIGAVFLPIGIVLTSIEALLFEGLFPLVGLSGEQSGSGDGVAVTFAGVGTGVGAAIVIAACAVALSRLAQGERPRVRAVYRVVGSRSWRLIWAVLRAAITIMLFGLTIIGAPIAVERTARWALIPQVCALRDPSDPPLRTSARLTRSNWWRTFLLTSVMNLPALALALLVGMAFLLLVPSAPVYSVEMVSSLVFALAYPYVGLATTLLYYDLVLSHPAREPSLAPAPVS